MFDSKSLRGIFVRFEHILGANLLVKSFFGATSVKYQTQLLAYHFTTTTTSILGILLLLTTVALWVFPFHTAICQSSLPSPFSRLQRTFPIFWIQFQIHSTHVASFANSELFVCSRWPSLQELIQVPCSLISTFQSNYPNFLSEPVLSKRQLHLFSLVTIRLEKTVRWFICSFGLKVWLIHATKLLLRWVHPFWKHSPRACSPDFDILYSVNQFVLSVRLDLPIST